MNECPYCRQSNGGFESNDDLIYTETPLMINGKKVYDIRFILFLSRHNKAMFSIVDDLNDEIDTKIFDFNFCPMCGKELKKYPKCEGCCHMNTDYYCDFCCRCSGEECDQDFFCDKKEVDA